MPAASSSISPRPRRASVGRMGRAQGLADALEQVLSRPGPLSPFAAELRSLAALEARAAHRAARIAQGREPSPPPAKRAPSPAEARAARESRHRAGALREALGEDTLAAMAEEAEEQRRPAPGGAFLREVLGDALVDDMASEAAEAGSWRAEAARRAAARRAAA